MQHKYIRNVLPLNINRQSVHFADKLLLSALDGLLVRRCNTLLVDAVANSGLGFFKLLYQQQQRGRLLKCSSTSSTCYCGCVQVKLRCHATELVHCQYISCVGHVAVMEIRLFLQRLHSHQKALAPYCYYFFLLQHLIQHAHHMFS